MSDRKQHIVRLSADLSNAIKAKLADSKLSFQEVAEGLLSSWVTGHGEFTLEEAIVGMALPKQDPEVKEQLDAKHAAFFEHLERRTADNEAVVSAAIKLTAQDLFESVGLDINKL